MALAGTLVFAGAVGGTAVSYLLNETKHLAETEAVRDIVEHTEQVEWVGGLASLDVSGPLSGDSLTQVDSVVAAHLGGGEILRVKIWNPDGTIVYSTSPEQVGDTADEEVGLRSAFAGKVWAEEPVGGKSDHDPDLEHVLEIYAPLYWSEGLTPDAVIEIYLDYGPQKDLFADLRSKVLNTMMLVFLTLPVGLGVLYRVGWSQYTWEHNRAEQRQREAEGLNRMLQHDNNAVLELQEGLELLHRSVQERHDAEHDVVHREHLTAFLADLGRLMDRA